MTDLHWISPLLAVSKWFLAVSSNVPGRHDDTQSPLRCALVKWPAAIQWVVTDVFRYTTIILVPYYGGRMMADYLSFLPLILYVW